MASLGEPENTWQSCKHYTNVGRKRKQKGTLFASHPVEFGLEMQIDLNLKYGTYIGQTYFCSY